MKSEKLLYLEGVRGIAAILVFLNHLKAAFAIDFTNDLLVTLKVVTGNYILSHLGQAVVSVFLDAGMASVYVFWFMSAYVISIKLHYNGSKDYLLKSFSKRYFRLLIPVTGSVMLSCILLYFDLFFNVEMGHLLGLEYTKGWVEGYFNFQPSFPIAIETSLWTTFFTPQDYIPYNPVLWTMYPELMGSFIIFGLFGILGKSNARNLIYLILSIIVISLELYWLASFVFGFWYCDYKYSRGEDSNRPRILSNKWFNHGFLLCVLILIGKQNFVDWSNLFLSSLLVILIIETKNFRKFLSRKQLVWLGKNSFSIYLIHFAIICSLGCYLYLVFDFGHVMNIICASLITIAVTLFFSSIYTKYVDSFGIRVSALVGNYVMNRGKKQDFD